MKNTLKLVACAAASVFAMQLTGCASMKMGAPAASIENTASLRTAAAAPASVGTFKAGDKMASSDAGTTIRGNGLASPVDNSFTQYLRESIKVELQAAGLYDARSDTVISGSLTDSALDAAIGTGTGSLAARFVVTRAGAVRYDRELKVNSSWDSSFMGAVAIPMAAQQYEGLYRKLVTTLLNDPDLRKALAK